MNNGMLYLMNVSTLTNITPNCDHFSSNGGNVHPSISKIYLKLPYTSQNFNLISFDLLNKARDPKVLGYPLTSPLTQNLGGG